MLSPASPWRVESTADGTGDVDMGFEAGIAGVT